MCWSTLLVQVILADTTITMQNHSDLHRSLDSLGRRSSVCENKQQARIMTRFSGWHTRKKTLIRMRLSTCQCSTQWSTRQCWQFVSMSGMSTAPLGLLPQFSLSSRLDVELNQRTKKIVLIKNTHTISPPLKGRRLEIITKT